MIKKIQTTLFNNFKNYLDFLVKYLNTTNRIKIVFLLFIFYALIIIITSFKYSILEYDYYKTLANKQQTTSIINNANRWTIYSNNNPVWILATSTELSDLAIDPQQAWSKEKLIDFLSDITFDELCFWQEKEDCLNNLWLFLKIQNIDNNFYDVNFSKHKIKENITNKISKKYIDFVLLKTNITDNDKFQITSLWQEWLFFVMNNLYANPTKINNSTLLSKQLSKILDLEEKTLNNQLKLRLVRYVKILNKLSLNIKNKIDLRILNEKNAIKKWVLDESNSIYKFIILTPNQTRFYPEKDLASQILWFVDNDNEWRYWIEWYFNEELKWKQWVRTTKKDISWRAIWLDDLSEKKIINWVDIKLTIDRNIQKEVSKILEAWIEEFKANKWSVIIMDPKSWAIVAMANYPDFDPNNFWNVYELEKVNHSKYLNPSFDLLWMPLFVEDSESWTDNYILGEKIKLRLATEKEFFNNALVKYKYKNNFWPWVYINDVISSLYEPWSVFKAITVSIWIDTWDINPLDMYKDNWFVEIDKFKISNVSSECTWYHTYSHALDWSCNVWMIDIVKKIWAPLFYKYLQDFWFDQKTNITLEWEVFSKIPAYEKWSRTKLFTMSFWQWINASLIQMAAAYSTIANWWIYMQPYIVETINLPSWQIIQNTPSPLRRVIKEETAKKVIAMLTEWAKLWFAKTWSVPWYDIAGKTWTSQIAYKWKYEEWWPWHTITSYWWFAPSSNPKFVMIVRIERPRSAIYSETTSSALFAKIAKYLLNYYWIPKNT